MRTLPLTVLAYEGPSARLYLIGLRQAGWRPQRIVHIVQSHHPATGKPVGCWLPSAWRRSWAEKTQERANNYWPRRIRVAYPDLVDSMVARMSELYPDAAEAVDEMLGPFDYSAYGESLNSVFVKDLRDERLVDTITQLASEQSVGRGDLHPVLFTGGGILPGKLLAIPGIRFIHVHPGYLPFVRGADGLLWSTLVRGRPGMSAFYMTPGIDEGNIIAAREYPELTFTLRNGRRPDDKTLYRALFSYCDPLLRAEFFVNGIVGDGSCLANRPTKTQDLAEGMTYHFMHDRLRALSLRKVFVSAEATSAALLPKASESLDSKLVASV